MAAGLDLSVAQPLARQITARNLISRMGLQIFIILFATKAIE